MKKISWEKWNSKENNFKKYESIKSKLIYGSLSKNIPDVSIMVLTYKRASGLKNALDSALNQKYNGTYEIIVCDDSGYDEETDSLMKDYCTKFKNIIYYRHEKNLGQYANWNRACELCRTEWYGLLHDDDMLEKNYLNLLMECVHKSNDIGLIGVYINAIDDREIEHSNSESFLSKLINLFINLRGGKPIELSLRDNIKHIFVMNTTFINKYKTIEVGGLDDLFFPSSDFVFSAKMAFYYKTIFLPEKLSYKGIVEGSESLKQSVCDDSIVCAYKLTESITKTLNYSVKKTKKLSSMAAVYSEIGVKGYNNVSYKKIKDKLNMKPIYDNKLVINLLNLYSKFSWGKLLFRRSKI